MAGNITQISINNEVKYKYTYDAHGRLTSEKDYVNSKYHEYIYNTTGNMDAHWTYSMNENGVPSEDEDSAVYYRYTDDDWPDQLSKYNGHTITYDNLGNPTEYHNGLKFEWKRGRQLTGIKEADNATEINDVTYKYNQNGLRTYKDTELATTTYEWDENTLIREMVTYKATNNTYDIWYFYDNNDEVIGFEYSYLYDLGEICKNRIYYEKDLQGNVIGLLDSSGTEIATYFYDAWGNITDSDYLEGYEIPYMLNHITYRSYYRDDESGFYYLQSRYYDAEVGRFINADLQIKYESNFKNYNLFTYCRNMPNTYYSKSGIIYQKILMKKRYEGQEADAYGYGGIIDCTEYLEDRYGGTIMLYKQKILAMSPMVMSSLEENANNCTLTAITRIFDYYRRKGYTNIDYSITEIYKDVKKVAKKYGYTNQKGTSPTKINNIVNKVADNYGYEKSKCRSLYLWNYYTEVKAEVDAGRPVIMNITSGYYGDHSVTVCGYKIYRKKITVGKLVYYKYYYMIAVYDGWSSEIRYIDYRSFVISSLGSFSKIKMKK